MAYRTVGAIHRFLSSMGVTCSQFDGDMFGSLGLQPPIVHGKVDCGGCTPVRLSCSAAGGGGPILVVEYLLMEFVIDQEMAQDMRIHWTAGSCSFAEEGECWSAIGRSATYTPHPPSELLSPDAVPCRWAWNTQLLLFDEYMRKRPGGYPEDIHIIQVTIPSCRLEHHLHVSSRGACTSEHPRLRSSQPRGFLT